MKDEKSTKKDSWFRNLAREAFSSRDESEDYADDGPYDKAGGYEKRESDTSKRTSSYSYSPDMSESYSKSYSSFDDVKSSSSSSFGGDSFGGYSDNTFGGYGGDNSFGDSNGGSNIHRMDKKIKFRLSILRLERLEDAVKVADQIMAGDTITLVDLRFVSKDIVRRIIDFLDGVRYTCEAKMEIVADYTYVVVPKDVELTGDLFSQIETEGI